MLLELPKDLFHVLPIPDPVPRDPMMYFVLEGHRSGRVFVDRPPSDKPSLVLIWTGMEYAYLIGQGSGRWAAAVYDTIEGTILPSLAQDGLEFVSVFPYGVATADLLDWFQERKPVSFGVNAFTFDRAKFHRLQAGVGAVPSGYGLLKLDGNSLALPSLQSIREDIIFCWGSVERFLELGLGYSIVDQQGEVASACYAIAFGAQAFHVTIWTRQAHRRKGLARQAAAALLRESLEADHSIYWINDAPNVASRKLAESLGFVYAIDLHPVDIPVHPYRFHLGLAKHFCEYLELYKQAGELYDVALSILDGDPDAYRQAARAWESAGYPAKARRYLKKASGCTLDSTMRWPEGHP
jgi:hypothetical protein